MSKLDQFREEAVQSAKEYEAKQASKNQGTSPNLGDITEKFNKNKSEIAIGERKFTIKKFGIRDTMTMVPILGNAIAVPLSALAGDKGSEEEVNGITNSLYLLFENMGNGKFFEIVDLLLSNTTTEGREINIEDDFEDISEVFQVCTKVLEVSFGPFMKTLDLSRMTGWLTNIQQLR